MKTSSNYIPTKATVAVGLLLAGLHATTRIEPCSGFVVTPGANTVAGANASNQRPGASGRPDFPPFYSSPPVPMALSLSLSVRSLVPPRIWIEDAEEGFVDEDENLEPGEVCLRSVKSFADGVPSNDPLESTEPTSSSVYKASSIRVMMHDVSEEKKQNHKDRKDNRGKRFLTAGALVQRPSYDSSPYHGEGESQSQSSDQSDSAPSSETTPTAICDAWMADSILSDGGPNLQLQGALRVLDDLFLFHLQREWKQQQQQQDQDPGRGGSSGGCGVRALKNFVVRCGGEEESACGAWGEGCEYRSEDFVAASGMAASVRGFSPLREMVRVDSFYDPGYYDHDLAGRVPDCRPGGTLDRYRAALAAAERSGDKGHSGTLRSICGLLPDEASIARHTTKRFRITGQKPPPGQAGGGGLH